MLVELGDEDFYRFACLTIVTTISELCHLEGTNLASADQQMHERQTVAAATSQCVGKGSASGPPVPAITAQAMELAKRPPPQEILRRQTSATWVAFVSLVLSAHLVPRGVALWLACLFQVLRGRESGPESQVEAVVFFCLFQLGPRWRYDSHHVNEHREESCGRSQRPFPFSPVRSPFHLTLSL
jgi:hypothetical protein